MSRRPINLRQLEAFRATCQSGSITAASKLLNISQPSVSRLISDLEQAVGFALFLRTGKGLKTTAEARRFAEAVESTFMGLVRLGETAEAIRSTRGGIITLGVIQSIATLELPRAVHALCQSHRDVRFMIHSRNTPAILDAVQSRQFDLGIVGRQPPYPGVETLFQTSAPYVCLLPEDHPLVGEAGALDLEKLTETDRFVTFGDAFPTEMLAIDSELSHRMQQNSRLSATNVPVAAALVRETGALAIADPFSAEQAVRMGGVVFRPIRQKLTYHIAIVCGGRENLSRPAGAFADLLARQISDRIEALSGYIQADD